MSVSVQAAEGSVYAQVIQSAHNRRRIDEQNGIKADDPAKARERQDAAQRAQASRESVSGDPEEYQRAYARAQSTLSSLSAPTAQTAVYSGVQNQGRRDELESMLAFSAYA
ncbi:MAG: hypothetical protein SPL30_00665 [Succinivibrio sp.]|jgi:hypothetical protein|nr:hypothetical protein [Succinivibrio sp.]